MSSQSLLSSNGTGLRHSRTGWSSDDKLKATEQAALELGHWLAGLRAYTSDENHLLRETDLGDAKPARQSRILTSSLAYISRSAVSFQASLEGPDRQADVREAGFGLTGADAGRISEALRELVLLSGSRVPDATTESWHTWRRFVFEAIARSQSVCRLIAFSEASAGELLPERLASLPRSPKLPERWRADISLILPRVAIIMSYLRLVAEMLASDEPLKRGILLFSRIDELMREMMEFINGRLQRFPDDSDPLFGSLDAAAYTASIELRKVQSNALKGLIEIRPTPLVFARIETAYSLLNDSLQMTLVNLAQLADRELEPTDIFPDLLTKEQQSVQLRENLWHLLQIVQKSEQEPDSILRDELNRELALFRDKNLYFLFYKDMETVDRFVEEVMITGDNKDLVPLLHRFGAYLETLLGQVNMRVVLAKHPFEPLQNDQAC